MKSDVPLEDALATAGSGKYTYLLIVMAGVVDLSAYVGIQFNSVVIPAAGCDLQLTTYQKGALTSMVYAGMLFTSHLWGFLADTYGRRWVMIICTTGSIFISILSSLAPNAGMLMFCSLVLGFLVAGLFTTIYVYVGECVPLQTRAKGIVILCAISAMVNIYLPSVAWLILPLNINIHIPFLDIYFSSWRLYIALLSVPFLFGTFFLYILPETPKFMLSKGRHDETMKILRKIYANNYGKKPEDYPVENIVLDRGDVMGKEDGKVGNPILSFFKTIFNQTVLIFSPPLLKYTVLSCMINIGVCGVYNVIVLWFPEVVNRLVNFSGDEAGGICDVMSGDITVATNSDLDPCKIQDNAFMMSIGNGALQIISFYLFSLIADKFPKRNMLLWVSTLATLSCGALIFVNNLYLIVGALTSGTILLLISFMIYITIVVDYFPTALRTNATSIVLLCGRIASVMGAQVLGLLFDTSCEFVYPGITAILIGTIVMLIVMPMSRKVED